MHTSTHIIRRLTMALAAAALVAATAASIGHGGVRPARSSNDVELTYTKWFAPSYPNMVGTVGGDIAGTFGGAVLQVTRPDFSARFLEIKAIYIIVANDPSKSFTARVEGVQDSQAGTADLDGRVLDGHLVDAHVHAHYKVISCSQAPNGTCFQGTITLTRQQEH